MVANITCEYAQLDLEPVSTLKAQAIQNDDKCNSYAQPKLNLNSINKLNRFYNVSVFVRK